MAMTAPGRSSGPGAAGARSVQPAHARPNQLDRLREDVQVGAADFAARAMGTITETGVATTSASDCSTSPPGWVGLGCVPINNLHGRRGYRGDLPCHCGSGCITRPESSMTGGGCRSNGARAYRARAAGTEGARRRTGSRTLRSLPPAPRSADAEPRFTAF